MNAPYSRTLNDLLAEMAGRYPNKAGLTWRDQKVTFAQWRQKSAAVAGALAGMGIRRGDTVGLLCTNRPEWLYSFFGASTIGATVAAFNTWVKTVDLEYLLGHSELSILVTLGRFRNQDYLAYLHELVPELWEAPPGHWRSVRFPHLRHVVVIGEEPPEGATSFDNWVEEGQRKPIYRLAPGLGATAVDPAVVVYTSGSTARPKAVPLQHYAIIENGFNIGERQGLGPRDRVWVSIPLFWSYGCANALSATMGHGATLVLQETFEAGEALDLIEGHKCTAAYLLPHIVRNLLEYPGFKRERTRSLRTGVMIGLPEDIRRGAVELGVKGLCNIYGSTETYGNCCVTPTTDPLDRRIRCQGPPLPGVTIRITDPKTGVALPPGEVGEVFVKGYVTQGYLKNPEATAAALTGDGFICTGDMGWLDDEGCFHFYARGSEMIKTGGINVSPAEVEEFLCTHPGVAEVAVTGVPHPVLGEVVVAFVVPVPGASVGPEELRTYCKQRIAAYKVPARIFRCTELPKTDTGKLSRRELKAWGQTLLLERG